MNSGDFSSLINVNGAMLLVFLCLFVVVFLPRMLLKKWPNQWSRKHAHLFNSFFFFLHHVLLFAIIGWLFVVSLRRRDNEATVRRCRDPPGASFRDGIVWGKKKKKTTQHNTVRPVSLPCYKCVCLIFESTFLRWTKGKS